MFTFCVNDTFGGFHKWRHLRIGNTWEISTQQVMRTHRPRHCVQFHQKASGGDHRCTNDMLCTCSLCSHILMNGHTQRSCLIYKKYGWYTRRVSHTFHQIQCSVWKYRDGKNERSGHSVAVVRDPPRLVSSHSSILIDRVIVLPHKWLFQTPRWPFTLHPSIHTVPFPIYTILTFISDI